MKILAIGFHAGALKSLEHIICNIDTWCVSAKEFPYNMTHDSALALWSKYKEKFNKYDVIITSDTTPLCRIFIEGGYRGKLIIWICNRFDYADGSFRFGKEYYNLLRRASFDPSVRMASYSKYDKLYASREDIIIDEVIKPTFMPVFNSPDGVYYIPDYQNNYTFDLGSKLPFQHKSGRHEEHELKDFYAIVHLPYHWQGVAEQKALQYCIPYYVPSKKLFFNLLATNKYWFQNKVDCYKYIDLCNFYDKDNKAVFYFDSLDDIKPLSVDRNGIFEYAQRLYELNRIKWRFLIWN
jgi:hypothetical protein